MKHVPIQLPINLMVGFGGLLCPNCGGKFLIMAEFDVETPNGVVKEMRPLGGSIPCPLCGEQSPMEDGSPYITVSPRKDPDKQD